MLNFSQLEFFATFELGDEERTLDRRAMLKTSVPVALLSSGLFGRRQTKKKEPR